jgi:hypothetical protein
MGSNLPWFKWYGRQYIADSIQRGWGEREHATYLIASCILWTETDEPGRYIIKGKAGSMTDFAQQIARICPANEGDRIPTQRVVNTLRTLSEHRVIYTSKSGVIECPFILKQLELSKKRAEAGKQSTTHFVQQNEPVCWTQNQKKSKKGIKTMLLRSMFKRAEDEK